MGRRPLRRGVHHQAGSEEQALTYIDAFLDTESTRTLALGRADLTQFVADNSRLDNVPVMHT